jgi:hypothetical protein
MNNKNINYDFALGGAFEQAVMKYMWVKHPENQTYYCKPDIYDVKNNVFYEMKDSRPYYLSNPNTSEIKTNDDIGTGMPVRQYNRYMEIINNDRSRVFMVHGMTEGRFKNKIFWTELTTTLSKKVLHTNSTTNGTVFWKYNDLEILNNNDTELIIEITSQIKNEDLYKKACDSFDKLTPELKQKFIQNKVNNSII